MYNWLIGIRLIQIWLTSLSKHTKQYSTLSVFLTDEPRISPGNKPGISGKSETMNTDDCEENRSFYDDEGDHLRPKRFDNQDSDNLYDNKSGSGQSPAFNDSRNPMTLMLPRFEVLYNKHINKPNDKETIDDEFQRTSQSYDLNMLKNNLDAKYDSRFTRGRKLSHDDNRFDVKNPVKLGVSSVIECVEHAERDFSTLWKNCNNKNEGSATKMLAISEFELMKLMEWSRRLNSLPVQDRESVGIKSPVNNGNGVSGVVDNQNVVHQDSPLRRRIGESLDSKDYKKAPDKVSLSILLYYYKMYYKCTHGCQHADSHTHARTLFIGASHVWPNQMVLTGAARLAAADCGNSMALYALGLSKKFLAILAFSYIWY